MSGTTTTERRNSMLIRTLLCRLMPGVLALVAALGVTPPKEWF